MSKMSIKSPQSFSKRIAIFPIILVSTFAIFYLVINHFSFRNEELLKEMSGKYLTGIETSLKLSENIKMVQRRMHDAVAVGDTTKIYEADSAAVRVYSLLELLSALTPGEKQLIELNSSFANYYPLARTATKRMIVEQFSESLANDIQLMIDRYNQLNTLVEQYEIASKEKIHIHVESIKENNKTAERVNGLIIIASLMMSVLVAYFLSKAVVKPFRELNDELTDANSRLLVSNETLINANKIIEEALLERNRLVEELTTLKNQLEISNNEKDKFFSIIAHDLKSPFLGFVGLTEVMATDLEAFTTEELKRYLFNIHGNAKRLYQLLQNLLEWSQLQRGTHEYQPQKLALNQVVFDVLEDLRERANQKGIKLEEKVDKGIFVYADKAMLASILRNLISNAIKFTRAEGSVSIFIPNNDSKYVTVAIRDTGVGMNEVQAKKLFKISEKIGEKGTDGEESTGLGLLLCKEFVENHGGSISFQTVKGSGTTFYFTLPVAV